MMRESIVQIIATLAGLGDQIKAGHVLSARVEKWGVIDINVDGQHAEEFFDAFPYASTESDDDQFMRHQMLFRHGDWTVTVRAWEGK